MVWVGSIALTRRAQVFAAVLVLAGLTGETCAEAGPQLASLRIVDRDTGQELRVWRHHGRLYVAGQPDERYSLRVANNTDGRILAVMSVDGVNIVSGETAGYDQRGYVLAPHQSIDVTGWRKSTTEVAAFSFSALSQSYAARTGRPFDVGAIGMAVFEEKPEDIEPPPTVSNRRRWGGARLAPPPPMDVPPPPLPLPPVRAPIPESITPPRPVTPAPPAPPAPPPSAGFQTQAASAARATVLREEKLGTAHGPREWSVVNLVNFERATPYPAFVEQIEYDSYANLAAIGVVPGGAAPGEHPRSFPSSTAEIGFAPDPPQGP